MPQKKTFSLVELQTLPAEEIIDKIQHSGFSLLESLARLGSPTAAKLRKEMAPIGRVCNAVVNYGYHGTHGSPDERTIAAKKKLLKLLAKLAPSEYDKTPKDRKDGLVIGFNHPSLGEIARILAMKIETMGDKPMYFPVNLPWYEALAPNFDRIKELGVVITPTITPATVSRLALQEGTDAYEATKRIKNDFLDIYLKLSHEGLKNGGVIFVAPSATRQATVFKNKDAFDGKEKIIPTMSKLAAQLYADETMNCAFVPLAILPPENYNRRLNLGKKYKLTFGRPLSAKYIRDKYFSGKDAESLDSFDYEFHERIAKELPKKFWY